ncbi:MAG TPA: tRNA (adenosine(37)-N6)-dimethylallyltransferase MiaA [Thermoanaerobaculia bacterium]|nr:tRNA (adenosine(37)-N6)-dimethylallyltransferase MiaA [Thermoanaerobaculia bacterium]
MSDRAVITVAVVGPTCTGKSGLALALARRYAAEIVNADALQVYRGLDRGTAKPDLAARAAVPHHLFDILDPCERFSAGEFARRARTAIDEIAARGRIPIVVGGSGFYLRALFRGLAGVPPIPLAVRDALRRRLEREGLEALRAELVERDPATARRLPPGDRQRTLRALEVVAATGRSLSSWQAEPSAEERLPVLSVGLTLPRALLYDRIAARAHAMLRGGWLEEIGDLLRGGVPDSAPAFQAIGYRQLLRHLQGACTLEEAMVEIIRATRRYAKRQETWFRREQVSAWFSSPDAFGLEQDVIEFLSREGIGGR